MVLPREFIELNLLFAQRVASLASISIAEALLDYTHIPLCLGLDRSFDPTHPAWLAYLQGLETARDAREWTWAFYLKRQGQIPPKEVPQPSFGCFSYALWPGGRVRLHFRNAEQEDCSPLSQDRLPIRWGELRAMFTHIRRHIPEPASVVGGSWLYNLDAYRRLFPQAFLGTASTGEGDYQFITLWGQFLNRRRQVRQEWAAQFRERLQTCWMPGSLKTCFPYQVIRLECPLEAFTRFYNLEDQG